MDTKLSVALLSGISLFMSLGAFALSEESGNDLNWSYAMGGTIQADPADFDELTAQLPPLEPRKEITCTEGCPARAPKKALTLTYEDEAMPLADRMDTEPVSKTARADLISVREKMGLDEPKPVVNQAQPAVQAGGASEAAVLTTWRAEDKPVLTETQNAVPQIETRYVETASDKVQYPVTRQYPISVQYPVTVQRNMTVEQPVVMQQPVIVRRPVIVQQDVTVRRQPTFIQQQPMIMQQQPSFIQQQPMYVQAPAAPMSQEMLSSINGMLAQPQIQMMPQQPQVLPIMPAQAPIAPVPQAEMPMTPNAYMAYPQQYQVQGQIQAQPIYNTMPAMYMQAPVVQQPMGLAQQPTAY